MKRNSEYSVDSSKDLNDLFKRLNPGDFVKGRVLKKIDSYKYIIRIFGYNIITASNSDLNEGAEVELKVKKTNDHLVIELISDLGSKNVDKQHLNIIV